MCVEASKACACVRVCVRLGLVVLSCFFPPFLPYFFLLVPFLPPLFPFFFSCLLFDIWVFLPFSPLFFWFFLFLIMNPSFGLPLVLRWRALLVCSGAPRVAVSARPSRSC